MKENYALTYKLSNYKKSKKFHIFGHTPIKKPYFHRRFANIDTGCAFKDAGGSLTALEYPSLKIYQQENID
jgi:serine/threonine protein phosphatase 1